MASKKPATKQQETKEVATVDEAAVPAMPDYMKAFVQQSAADAGSMISSSISVPRLSYRGKRWRWIVDGEEELVKELTIDVVIVGVEPDAGRFIKTYYLSDYKPGDTTPPDCSSSNGIAPDSWVSSPQANRCQGCPKNIFGSAVSRTGGKAKACHDGKRLWLVRPDDDLDIVYGLNIPIMSMKNLAEYGKYIARNNFPLALVITRLSLDDEAEFPKVCFEHVGFVEEEISNTVIELNQRRPWKAIQTPLAPELPAPAQNSGPAQIAQGQDRSAGPERKIGGADVADIVGQWESK